MSNIPEKGRGKPISKQALYQSASSHAKEAIDVLVKEMKGGDNSNARTGAAKALLDKCLPNLKATDVKVGGDLLIKALVQFLDGNSNNSDTN